MQLKNVMIVSEITYLMHNLAHFGSTSIVYYIVYYTAYENLYKHVGHVGTL